jgi:hypothetical protein
MSCKWSSEAADYLTDRTPCRRDEHGDPTKHCTGRKGCSSHVGPRELTCGRCITDVRNHIRTIRDFAALMPTEALHDGVNSEAAVMAGPATDVRRWSDRQTTKLAALLAWEATGKISEQQYARGRAQVEDDDEWHPHTVLTRNHWLVAMTPDYPPPPDVFTLVDSAAYLDQHLHRIAQDDRQDFAQLRREVRKCREHLETVLHNSTKLERGAPCPDCSGDGHYVRLQRHYAHWCYEPDCCKEHHATDEADRWLCPKNHEHVWTVKAYRDYIEERTA